MDSWWVGLIALLVYMGSLSVLLWLFCVIFGPKDSA